jgi:hypothetical protein
MTLHGGTSQSDPPGNRGVHRQILGDKLTGLYVHGSLAFGCFRWETGDIDYLAVVKEPLSTAEKVGLIEALLRMDRAAPPKGLEMSVVLEQHCRTLSTRPRLISIFPTCIKKKPAGIRPRIVDGCTARTRTSRPTSR